MRRRIIAGEMAALVPPRRGAKPTTTTISSAPIIPTTTDRSPTMVNKPAIIPLTAAPENPSDKEPITIAKPDEFSLERFRSKRDPVIAGVETLITALPHYSMSQAKDWVRLHPNEEEYWSPEFCFVNVPVKGQKHLILHFIDEELALQHLSSSRIKRFRLALASKPYDVFFLCRVPPRNLDILWNDSNLRACICAKKLWTQATSRKDEGYEEYKIDYAKNQDAFPEPSWPKQELKKLIHLSFTGYMIDRADHPALLRLIGARQSTS
jgi:hypothetical protein